MYILDRITGEPLVGIEERPVPQEERQATAATQPYPVGDAFVSALDIAPEGFRMVNGSDIFRLSGMTRCCFGGEAGGHRVLLVEQGRDLCLRR